MGNYLFDKVQIRKPKHNAFSLKNIHRFSAEFGYLYPTKLIEVLPGDIFKMDFTSLVRMAPMVNPVMSHIDVDIRAFFVPNRIICDHWEEFITGGTNGQSAKQLPYFIFGSGTNYHTHSTFGVGTLCDYLGVKFPNKNMTTGLKCNLLPFKAYQKIYNDWYRDELLDAEIPLHTDVNGADSYWSNYVNLRSRRYAKDYFTSARPTAQLGSPVTMGIEVMGSLISDGPLAFASDLTDTNAKFHFDQEQEQTYLTDQNGNYSEYEGGIAISDTTQASLNIADLRRFFRIQSWNEKSIRTGNRYIESLLAHWGVRSSDSRLQRSEYIGGVSSPVLISDIDNTTDAGTRPFGSIAGKGTSVGTPKTLKFRAEEHGYIIVLLSVLPKVGYNQGIDRTFLREDKFDYAWPEFAHIGEQEIYNCEIFNDGNKGTFGYQSRFAEYKSALDQVSGEFRTSLSTWIQNRNFENRPTLSGQFLDVSESLPVLNEIFAVEEGVNHFYCEVMHNIKVLRLISKWSEPSVI